MVYRDGVYDSKAQGGTHHLALFHREEQSGGFTKRLRARLAKDRS